MVDEGPSDSHGDVDPKPDPDSGDAEVEPPLEAGTVRLEDDEFCTAEEDRLLDGPSEFCAVAGKEVLEDTGAEMDPAGGVVIEPKPVDSEASAVGPEEPPVVVGGGFDWELDGSDVSSVDPEVPPIIDRDDVSMFGPEELLVAVSDEFNWELDASEVGLDEPLVTVGDEFDWELGSDAVVIELTVVDADQDTLAADERPAAVVDELFRSKDAVELVLGEEREALRPVLDVGPVDEAGLEVEARLVLGAGPEAEV